jgi:hypothetical protein
VKIRMQVDISGTRGDGRDWPRRGGEIDVDDQEGADLCAGGLATPVAVDEPVETRAEPTAAEVRAWAVEQGIDVAAKGAVPADVIEQYKAAQS